MSIVGGDDLDAPTGGIVIMPGPARLNRKTFLRQQADAARHRLAYRRETSNRAWVSLVVDEDKRDHAF